MRNLMDPTAVERSGQDLATIFLQDGEGIPVLQHGELELGFAVHVLALPHAHLRQLAAILNVRRCHNAHAVAFGTELLWQALSCTNMPKRMGRPANDAYCI